MSSKFFKSRQLTMMALAFLPLFAWAAGGRGQEAAATDPLGRWITANGNLEVEISPCGKALCGKVLRVLGNRSMVAGEGEMKPVDTRPALGMQILSDFLPVHGPEADHDAQAEHEWRGQIYNRETGKSYACQMRVDTQTQARGELLLHAYVGLPLFGKTQRWQRAVEAESATALPGRQD